MDSQVLSHGAATPTMELTSSPEAVTFTTLQLKKIVDLLLITKDSQAQSYNQDEEVKLFWIV